MKEQNDKTVYGDSPDDRVISGLVRSVKYRVPEDLDHRLAHMMDTDEPHVPARKRRFAFRPALAAAMLVFIAVLTVIIVNRGHGPVDEYAAATNGKPAMAENKIDEIKTEFEIKNKNIKILWVQKQNFKLRRTQP